MFFHQGILEDKPDALKLRVGYDYNNQLASIEGMILREFESCYKVLYVVAGVQFTNYRRHCMITALGYR